MTHAVDAGVYTLVVTLQHRSAESWCFQVHRECSQKHRGAYTRTAVHYFGAEIQIDRVTRTNMANHCGNRAAPQCKSMVY